jgi:hypothetical protein
VAGGLVLVLHEQAPEHAWQCVCYHLEDARLVHHGERQTTHPGIAD